MRAGSVEGNEEADFIEERKSFWIGHGGIGG